MLFSAFAPFGMFAFSSKATHGEAIYRAMYNGLVDAYDLTPGGHAEASLYARSMGVARARYTLQRAGNQYNPLKAIEMLPALERDWGSVPSETDGILQRQRNVAAKELISLGSRYSNLYTVLRNILGADLIAVRMRKPSEVTPEFPTSNFARVELPAKNVRFTTSVCPSTLPAAVTVRYENLITDAATVTLTAGEKLTVQPENNGLCEVVTVTSTIAGAFTATFTKSHDRGATATTQNYPRWYSNQRSFWVVVSATAAVDAEKRRRVNEALDALVTAGTTWAIVEETSPTTLGPFTVGVSPIGITPIGTVTLP